MLANPENLKYTLNMKGRFKVYLRNLTEILNEVLAEKYSVLLLGPRQTGKTTLVKKLLLPAFRNVLEYSLTDPQLRLEFETDPRKLIREVEAHNFPLVFIDEIQKVPQLLDAVQYLIDNQRAFFVITGSSARKLRRKGTNLLAGRVLSFYLTPLTWNEIGIKPQNYLGLKPKLKKLNSADTSLEDQLIFGSLPPVLLASNRYKELILRAYAQVYLQEEIRQEALVRKIGAFSRFLELTALESGSSPNYTQLSQQSGVSVPAIRAFFQILEDTLLVRRLDPYLKSPRKRLFSRPKYYYFDIGVRNALAKLVFSEELLKLQKGLLFEHFVILELFRRSSLPEADFSLYWWRTLNGAEVDCVIEKADGSLIPLEIKATNRINLAKLKGLISFLKTHPQAKVGYVVSLVDRPEKIKENIVAIPWWML